MRIHIFVLAKYIDLLKLIRYAAKSYFNSRMRRSSVKHNTFDVLSFILQGKGGDKDEAQIKEAISNIKRRMTEIEDEAADLPYE